MKYFLLIIILFQFSLSSCSKVRESAGVTRKSLDEFSVVENPPLVIPPDFNLMPPEQLEEKKLNNVEKELAKEILYGLENSENSNLEAQSTMNQILDATEANETDTNIRKEIDEQFANEKNSETIFSLEWETENEVLDAIKESERIRNQLMKGESLSDGEVPTKIKKTKIKKKKRFFFF